MDAGRLHPALARELARLGRAWGALNDVWLASTRDYAHGSPAFKWSGADPVGGAAHRGAHATYKAATSPLRDRTKEKRPEVRELVVDRSWSTPEKTEPNV